MISWMLRKSIVLVPWTLREKVKNQPAVASFQRALLQRLLSGKEFIHVVDAGPAQGLKCFVELPADKGIWTGTYEQHVATALSELIAPGDICYDVGGWRGFFSGVMALANAEKVFVFEPLHENVTRIRRIVELNPQLPIELLDISVGEHDGRAEFLVMPESSMGKLATSRFQGTAREVDRISVKIAALDSLIERNIIPPPQVVKIDVEGAELSVLRGFSRGLQKHQPVMFLEVHSRELARACDGFLRLREYDITVVETGKAPDYKSEPEVCHFVARSSLHRRPAN